MALSYDPSSRRWNLSYERTDYPIPDTSPEQITLWTTNQGDISTNGFAGVTFNPDANVTVHAFTVPYNATPSQIARAAAVKYKEIGANRANVTLDQATGFYNTEVSRQQSSINQRVEIATATQQIKEETARRTAELNQLNAVKNTAYDRTIATANSTQGGDYVTQRNILRNLEGLDNQTKQTLESYYRAFYTTEKLQTWDSNLGAQPPYGTFDPNYYKTQNPTVAQQWQSAVANDDVDITERYGENGYYLQHYTSVGKNSGARGNAAEDLEAAQRYTETAPTDSDLQQVRNLQLGVDTNTQTERLLNIPEIAAEWEKAKAGDSYWKQKAKESFLDIDKPDEFAALFRLSDRPEDKEIVFNYNVNSGYGITELEDALNEAVGEKAIVDVKRFGALTQDVLKQTIAEMKKAKAREQQLSMFSSFDTFSDITNINRDLTNSILGDSGVGGVLSYMGGGKAEESLEKSLRGITGVNNNVTYNWQQWFDNTLKERYQSDLELGLSSEEAQNNVEIQGAFAREFIDKYLVPRFNESRSMNEFVEYLDVRQSEQNPFQTQDILNATKLVADLRAQQFLDQLKQTPERYFDSEFYFNPTGDKAREENYRNQASTVTADWEAAKGGDDYWRNQAYRFGVDVNDKDAFARMHFQIKGRADGYDAADDILNASKVSEYIYGQILPALKEEALNQGTVFGQFIKPEEFADEMLKGLDPSDTETWNEVLKQYGLTDFKGTIDELKNYIIETLRTGSAQEIREQIKYLNEKRQKPTQEKLGVSYIQREEDYKPDKQIKGDTQLYKTFQTAGYKGTEDEFYENFFPDLDRSEQVALTKAGTDSPFEISRLDLKNPFESLGTIESLLGEEEETADTTVSKPSGFFSLGLDDEEEGYTKTKSGSQILGEFTSMFKGL